MVNPQNRTAVWQTAETNAVPLGLIDISASREFGHNRRARHAGKCGYTLVEMMIVLSLITAFALVTGPQLMRPWYKSQIQLSAAQLTEVLAEARFAAIENGTPFEFRWKPGTGEYQVTSRDPIEQISESVSPTMSEIPINGTAPIEAVPGTLSSSASDSLRGNNTAVLQDNTSLSVASQLVPPGFTLALTLGTLSDGTRFAPTSSNSNAIRGESSDGSISDNMADLAANNAEKTLGDAALLGEDAPDGLLMNVPWSGPIVFFPDGSSSGGDLSLVGDNDYSLSLIVRSLTGTAIVSKPQAVLTPGADLTDDGVPDDLPAPGSLP